MALGVWPDGHLTSAVASGTGVHHSTGLESDLSQDRAWTCLGPSAGEGAHCVGLAVNGVHGAVVWSAPDGLRIVRLTRGGPVQPGLPRPGRVQRFPVSMPASTGAPVAVLMTDDSLDVLWSPDRHTVQWLNERPGIPLAPREPRYDLRLRGERLRQLDVALDGPGTAWLAATTERGAFLLTRWDLLYDVFEPWVRPRCPMSAVRQAAVANVHGIPTLVVAAYEGALLTTDARAAAAGHEAWEVLNIPPGTRGPATGVVAAADHLGECHLAEATHDRMWSTRLTREDEQVRCQAVLEAELH